MQSVVTVVRGDTWQRGWILTDSAGVVIPLTGATARLQVRNAADTLLTEASLVDGRLVATIAAGRIDLIMPASAMVLAVGFHFFDLEVIFTSGIKRTYEQGTLIVEKDYTI